MTEQNRTGMTCEQTCGPMAKAGFHSMLCVTIEKLTQKPTPTAGTALPLPLEAKRVDATHAVIYGADGMQVAKMIGHEDAWRRAQVLVSCANVAEKALDAAGRAQTALHYLRGLVLKHGDFEAISRLEDGLNEPVPGRLDIGDKLTATGAHGRTAGTKHVVTRMLPNTVWTIGLTPGDAYHNVEDFVDKEVFTEVFRVDVGQ